MPEAVFENRPLLIRNYSCTLEFRRLSFRFKRLILKILSKVFWRWILPTLLGFSLAIDWILMGTKDLSPAEIIPGQIGVYADVLAFVVCLVAALRKTLPWGKEAEGFEMRLVEADAIERERRRRSTWVER
jgi:hypothetical protein